MSPRFRSSFAAPTGFVAAVTRTKPDVASASRQVALPISVGEHVSSDRKAQPTAV